MLSLLFLMKDFKSPNTHYIGEAWLYRILSADEEVNYFITKATFNANSTLDWHKHASVQILIHDDGQGYYQERGKELIILKAGEVLKFGKEVKHWHSYTKNCDVTYLAIYWGDTPTTWTEVLNHEY